MLDVLAAAATWLRARGVEQWPERFPAGWVMPPIERGETWLAEADSRVVGTLTVQWTDELFWGKQAPDAGYLHRLAVTEHGSGRGEQLPQWAERHAASAGKSYLRLDCVASNVRLRTYYEQSGYAYLGDAAVGSYTQSLYEKRVLE